MFYRNYYYKLVGIICCLPLLSWAQGIHYFSTDNNSFLRADLYAKVNGRVYTLIDSSEQLCISLEHTADYNKDGKKDVLIGYIHGCGGNCCTNSYSIFYLKEGRFVQTKLVGDGEYLATEKYKNQLSILLHSRKRTNKPGHYKWIKERYLMQADTIAKVEEYQSEKVNDSESDYWLSWEGTTTTKQTYFIHTIRKEGQSLWALANKYKTTVAALKALNAYQSDIIYIGMQIKIPKKNAKDFITYKVTAGETLWGISQKYKVPVAIIKKVNALTEDQIQLGQFLKIPKRG